MNVLEYIVHCLILPVSLSNGYGSMVEHNWYDIFVSIALYLIIFAILFIIAIPIKRYRKKQKEQRRKENHIKNFMDSEEEIDNNQEKDNKQQSDDKQE